jgi:hypothetical protein
VKISKLSQHLLNQKVNFRECGGFLSGITFFGESINCDKLTQILSVYAFGELTNSEKLNIMRLLLLCVLQLIQKIVNLHSVFWMNFRFLEKSFWRNR